MCVCPTCFMLIKIYTNIKWWCCVFAFYSYFKMCIFRFIHFASRFFPIVFPNEKCAVWYVCVRDKTTNLMFLVYLKETLRKKERERDGKVYDLLHKVRFICIVLKQNENRKKKQAATFRTLFSQRYSEAKNGKQ